MRCRAIGAASARAPCSRPSADRSNGIKEKAGECRLLSFFVGALASFACDSSRRWQKLALCFFILALCFYPRPDRVPPILFVGLSARFAAAPRALEKVLQMAIPKNVRSQTHSQIDKHLRGSPDPRSDLQSADDTVSTRPIPERMFAATSDCVTMRASACAMCSSVASSSCAAKTASAVHRRAC